MAFPFRLHNEASASVTYQFRLEVEDPLHLDDWSVRGPTVLGAGEVAQATLSVHVPSSGVEPGVYRLRLLAVTPGQAGAVGGDFVLVVEARPCVLFPSPPKIHLNPDGSFSLSLNILDCGDVDLDVTVDVRHRRGWAFDVSRPDFHLGAHVGPVNVDLTLHSPPGKTAAPGDQVTVSLNYHGVPVVTDNRPIEAAAAGGGITSRLIGVIGGVLGLLVLLGGGFVLWHRLHPGSPSPPTNLAAKVDATGVLVHLSWSYDAGAVDGFEVYRNGARLLGLGDPFEYDDRQVSPGSTYRYAVEAVKGGRRSSPSNEAVVEIPARRWTLSVKTTGTGTGVVRSLPSGISCPTTCATAFAEGGTITLTATPTGGTSFAGWGRACSGTGTCQVTLKADQVVTAQFVGTRTLTIDFNGAGSGTVTGTSGDPCTITCTERFPDGLVVTLTATAGPGSGFRGWQSCPRTAAPSILPPSSSIPRPECVLTMRADQAVTATFYPILR